jgi:anti-sigma-K factor RskA
MTDRRLEHEAVAELVAALALDALEPSEHAIAEAHVVECERCRAELAAHREVVALLATSATEVPVGTWERIAAAIRTAPRAAPPSIPDTVAPPGPGAEEPVDRLRGVESDRSSARSSGVALGRRSSRGLDRSGTVAHGWARRVASGTAALGLAAALAAVALLANQVVGLDRKVASLEVVSSQRTVAAAAALALADPVAKRMAFLEAGSNRVVAEVAVLPNGVAYLVNVGMASLPSFRTYQLWGVFGQSAVSLGVLGRDPRTVAFAVDPAAPPRRLAMTVEPAGGSTSPTTTPVAATSA